MKEVIIFTATVLLLTSCSKPSVRDCNGGTVGDSARVAMAMDESATVFDCHFGNLTIHFVKMDDDSRCSSQMDCVWFGAAGISVSINNDKTLIPIRLDSTSILKVNQESYLLKFEKLAPYPTSSPIIPANYKATLFLQRN